MLIKKQSIFQYYLTIQPEVHFLISNTSISILNSLGIEIKRFEELIENLKDIYHNFIIHLLFKV